MFWNKKKDPDSTTKFDASLFLKECWLYISPELKEIIFVPTIKSVDGYLTAEQEKVIVKPWPLDPEQIGNLTLDCFNNCKPTTSEVNTETWPSLENSKAKTQRKFKVEYILIQIIQRAENMNWCDLRAYPYYVNDAEFHLGAGAALTTTSLGSAINTLLVGCQKIRN